MGDFAPYINKIISEYEAENANIKIKWIDVPFSEGEKRTLAAVMTDCPPDLINLNPDFSALLAQKGTLYEIEARKLADFNPQIVEALKYNDKIYSIPWYATSAITIYNKDLFQKAQEGYNCEQVEQYIDALKAEYKKVVEIAKATDATNKKLKKICASLSEENKAYKAGAAAPATATPMIANPHHGNDFCSSIMPSIIIGSSIISG